MKFQLRPALTSDLDSILALERATENAPHWPRATYFAILSEPEQPRCIFVAEVEGEVAGFAVGLLHPASAGEAELESVVVAKNVRRAGIGGALCRATIDWCAVRGAREVVLEVRAASLGAIALYLRRGFKETGRRRAYYRNPDDDAVLMRLDVVVR